MCLYENLSPFNLISHTTPVNNHPSIHYSQILRKLLHLVSVRLQLKADNYLNLAILEKISCAHHALFLLKTSSLKPKVKTWYILFRLCIINCNAIEVVDRISNKLQTHEWQGWVLSILNDCLNIRKLSATWVRCLLTSDHKRSRVTTSKECLA